MSVLVEVQTGGLRGAVGCLRRTSGVLAAILFWAACGNPAQDAEDPSEDGAVTRRDSAGIEIVENAAGLRDTFPAGEPVLTIARSGDERYEFFQVQDVIALSDGRIVVANRGSHEVRYYSPDGRHLASLGGEGEGPGEFRVLSELQRLRGDTVVASDAGNRRLGIYAPRPAFVESLGYVDRLAPRPESFTVCGAGDPRFGGILQTRTLVLWSPVCIEGQGSEGLRPLEQWIHIWEPGAEQSIRFGPITRAWRVERPGEALPNRFAPVPLRAGVGLDVTQSRIYVASPNGYVVRVLDETGSPVMLVRDLTQRRPVDADLRARFEDALPAERVEELATSHYPDSVPAFDHVVVGDEEIWARHYRAPMDTGKYWSVYEKDGAAEGIVVFPLSFELTAVHGGRAYGVHTDEMDVERIQVFSPQRR